MSKDKLSNILDEIEQAENKKIYRHKSKSIDDRLLRIINNNKKKNRNSTFKSKRNKIKKILYTPSKKMSFKSKIKEIVKILGDIKINKDRKIEEIKKTLYEPKKEDDYY